MLANVDDTVKLILTNLGVTGVLGALLVWWLRTYLDRRMDVHFKKAEKLVDIALEMRKKRVVERAKFLQDILQASTHCRNGLRILVNAPTDDQLHQFASAYEELEALLYTSELLIPVESWKVLHRYKRTLQHVTMAATVEGTAVFKEASSKQMIEKIELMHKDVQRVVREEFDVLEDVESDDDT